MFQADLRAQRVPAQEGGKRESRTSACSAEEDRRHTSWLRIWRGLVPGSMFQMALTLDTRSRWAILGIGGEKRVSERAYGVRGKQALRH